MIAAAAIAALSAIAAVFARRTVRASRRSGRKLLLGRRRKQRLARQTDLASVRLDADNLHFDFVAELEEIRYLSDARVCHLRDVQQSVLTRQNLDERAVRLDALHRTLVVLADFRRRGQAFDDVDGSLRGCSIDRRHGDFAVVLDIDLGSRLFDDPADRFAAGADDVANAILRNENRIEPRRELGELGLRFGDDVVHLVEDEQPPFLRLLERLSHDLAGNAGDFDVHLQCGDSLARAGDFEIHVAFVILEASYISQYYSAR